MTVKNHLFKNSRPLKYFIFSFSCVVFAVILTSCEQNPTAPNEPPKPYGYQEDIYWPSLADSPWPMDHHNPQNTGRSQFSGPSKGIIEWKIEIPRYGSNDDTFLSAVNSFDPTIYVVSSNDVEYPYSFLYAINFSGNIKWKFPLPYDDEPTGENSTPAIVKSDGIIHTADRGGNVYAINSEGELIWKVKLNGIVLSKMVIDKAGYLYCVTQFGLVYAISKEGSVIWELELPDAFAGSSSSVSFSPDGNTIYIATNRISAISKSGLLLWETSKESNTIYHSPLIDSKGNIYFYYSSDSDSLWGFMSIDKNSITRYIYHDMFFVWANPTMDRNGNIYIANEPDIISLDYNGNLRWRLTNVFYGSSISCDKDGMVYFVDGLGTLKCIDSKGQVIWEIPNIGRAYESLTITNNRLYFGAITDSGKYFYCIK